MNKEIEPLSDAQIKRIVKNIVTACQDISKLNKTGYSFIYLASGFIAHNDIHGFIHHYDSEGVLRNDILHFQSRNQWGNFKLDEPNYLYYKSKQKCYNLICEKLESIG